jgi:hypothetical protein
MISEQKEKIYYYSCALISLFIVISGFYYTHLLIAIQIADLIQQIKEMQVVILYITTIPITICLCYGGF